MKSRIEEAFRDKIAVLLGVCITLFIGIVIYTYTVSLENPITIVNNPVKPLQAKAGGTVVLCRGVEYKARLFSESIEFTLSRSMTLKEGNEQHTISFGSFDIIRKEGAKVICRNISLPAEMKAGIWTAHTYLKVHTTPWWTKTFEVAPFEIEVTK